MLTPFQLEFPLDVRKSEATRLMQEYKNMVPIIAEKGTGSKIPEKGDRKFIVPRDLTIGQFVYALRKRIELTPTQLVYVLVDGDIPKTETTMGPLYDLYKQQHPDGDGFLYITFREKNLDGTIFVSRKDK
ncbi:putative microtubule binding protein [Blattamonas nauphoetae]|uniref:Autophagy-related protein n=1 Tax=Blattamonas nauphoetae TaxID=2049346 RepID=A0ABQ9XME8_9EUKA|nr:putative microtubule binding protein [Blattamonas nauphoetae]